MEVTRILALAAFALVPLIFLGAALITRPREFPQDEPRPRSLRGPGDDPRSR